LKKCADDLGVVAGNKEDQIKKNDMCVGSTHEKNDLNFKEILYECGAVDSTGLS
jgi:hypothetical protein